MPEMICFIGLKTDGFSKKEIQSIFNGIYNSDTFEPQFYSCCDEQGYIALEIIDTKEERQVGLAELTSLKNTHFLLNEERKEIYKDFLKKLNKDEFNNKIDIFVYTPWEGQNESFYDKLWKNCFE